MPNFYRADLRRLLKRRDVDPAGAGRQAQVDGGARAGVLEGVAQGFLHDAVGGQLHAEVQPVGSAGSQSLQQPISQRSDLGLQGDVRLLAPPRAADSKRRVRSAACGFAADQADVSVSLCYLRSMQIHLTEFHGKDWTEVSEPVGKGCSRRTRGPGPQVVILLRIPVCATPGCWCRDRVARYPSDLTDAQWEF
jgi:hypothetical protein